VDPVVTIGIAGALALRAVAIVVGVALIETVEGVVYVFGALLLYVAYRAFRGADEEANPANSVALRSVRHCSPNNRRVPREEGVRARGRPADGYAAAPDHPRDRGRRHRIRDWTPSRRRSRSLATPR
jgi:hypothetical protein